MKINENDLEPTLRAKVDALDQVSASKEPGFLRYDGKAISADSINELKLSEVFSEDDVSAMLARRYSSEGNFASAFDTPMNGSQGASGAASLLSAIQGSELFRLEGSAVMVRSFPDFFLILDSSGAITKISKSDIADRVSRNVIDVIHENFVYRNFGVGSVTGIDYWDGSAIIATEFDGIFSVSLTGKEFSLKFKEPNVRGIRILGDNRTLAVSKDGIGGNIVFYDMRDGVKTAIFGNLGNRFQSPSELVSGGQMAFAIGHPIGVTIPDKILHAWQLDQAKDQYDIIDYKVAKNGIDPANHVKFVKCCGKFVFVVGERANHMFAWSYDTTSINTSPDVLEFDAFPASLDDIKDFEYSGGRYKVAIKNRVFVLDSNFNIVENYSLRGVGERDKVFIDGKCYIAFSGNLCRSFISPGYHYQKTLKFEILNSEHGCNNIDVLVDASGKFKMAFVDAETGLAIVPFFYMKLDERYHVIKICGQEHRKISMIAEVEDGERIDSIIVHNDRIFYK